MANTTTSPCNIKIETNDALKVAWGCDDQKNRILIRITKLTNDVETIKCITTPEHGTDLLETIDFSNVAKHPTRPPVKAKFYHKKSNGEIQIKFDGVEYATDVFGNQLTSFIEAKGWVVQIDIGQEDQLTKPCKIKIGNDDAIEVDWWFDELELPQGTPKNRILIRIRKLNNAVKEIKCVMTPEQGTYLLQKIDFLDVANIATRPPVKAEFYYKRGKQEIQIKFIGVENAIDVFSNQLTNFIEAKGWVIQIDIGTKDQLTGECLFSRMLKSDPHCRQKYVFLWKGNTYLCDDDGKYHISGSDSFCRCCAQIIKGRDLLECPQHEDSQALHRDGLKLEPVT